MSVRRYYRITGFGRRVAVGGDRAAVEAREPGRREFVAGIEVGIGMCCVDRLYRILILLCRRRVVPDSHRGITYQFPPTGCIHHLADQKRQLACAKSS